MMEVRRVTPWPSSQCPKLWGMICASYAEFLHVSELALMLMGEENSVCGRGICLISSETCECKACMLRSSLCVRSWGGREGALEGEQVGEERRCKLEDRITIVGIILTDQFIARQNPDGITLHRLTWAQGLMTLPEPQSLKLPSA